MVFARLRLKVDLRPAAGHEYTLVHPYGERTIKTDPGEDNFFVTEDIGASPARSTTPSRAASRRSCKWDPAIAPAAPDGYIGDPNIDHQITGGVEQLLRDHRPRRRREQADRRHPGLRRRRDGQGARGPRRRAPRRPTASSRTSSRSWARRPRTPASTSSATRSRVTPPATRRVDVLADSDADQTIVVQDPNAARRATTQPAVPDHEDGRAGRQVLRRTSSWPPSASFPSSTDNQVEVVNGTDGNPQAQEGRHAGRRDPRADGDVHDARRLLAGQARRHREVERPVRRRQRRPVGRQPGRRLARQPRRHRQRDADRSADPAGAPSRSPRARAARSTCRSTST